MQNSVRVQPIYYNEGILIKSPDIIYRTNTGDKRYYYKITDEGEILREASVTTILQKVMPTSEYLIKAIAELGYNQAMAKFQKAGEFGTLEHICFSDFTLKKEFDLSTIPARIATFKITKGIDYNTDFWAWELEKDIRAYEVFAATHEIEPVAISLMLFSKELGIAGEIDCILKMKIGTGVNGNILKTDLKIDKNGVILLDKTREIYVIMDWKSGRHGFYPNNEAQLHMYNLLFKENYPHLPIDALYNWSPKNWETEPDYNLKDQTDSIEALKIQHYIDLFHISDKDRQAPKYFSEQEGILKLGQRNGNFRLETPDERLKRIHQVIHPKRNGNGLGKASVSVTVNPEPQKFQTKAVESEQTPQKIETEVPQKSETIIPENIALERPEVLFPAQEVSIEKANELSNSILKTINPGF